MSHGGAVPRGPGVVASTAGRAAAITLLVSAALAILFLAFPSGTLWEGLEPADCTEYCERHTSCGRLATRPSVQQPLNTWSNLAFLFVGLLAIRRQPAAGAVLFAASCAVLFAGSLLFHASLTRTFQWLDVAGMFCVMTALAAVGLHKVWHVPYAILVPAALLANAALAAFKWRLSTPLVLAGLTIVVAMAMAAAVRSQRQTPALAKLGLALFVVAYVVRELDVNRALCTPDSLWFQGHALWHVLTAGAIYAAYAFFDGINTEPKIGST